MSISRITYLSLGSNQENKLQHLQTAVAIIAERIGGVTRVSKVYKTASWGFESEAFLNICIQVATILNPETLLQKLLQIEKDLGRKRSKECDGDRYQDRVIDIDILMFDNEIIFDKNLIVPHPKMLQRKFVLVPLVDIASKTMHPIAKQTIAKCLAVCTDTSEVQQIDAVIVRPISISEKYNYIAIEGNIGAGKTTLTKMFANDFNAKIVLERFADNPFLPKFYEDKDRFAFPLEMSFLADRYQQLTDDLAQFDLFKNFIVSDYYIFKSLIFAQVTLQNDEYFLYRKMFDIMYKEITKPDLYIYLYQNTDRLLENIKKRGRDYEQNIEPAYLEKIHKGYANFIKTEEHLNTLVIDVSDLDFVSNAKDYQQIINLVKKHP